MRRRPRPAVGTLVVAFLLSGIMDGQAQESSADVTMSTGVAPDTVTVGDHFRVGIRVSLPPGATAAFPTFDDPTRSLQLSEAARMVRDPADPRTIVQVYPLVAWRTNVRPPIVPVEIALPDGTTRRLRMELPLPHVRSVLPADTASVLPRGHRGIIEADTRLPLWPLLLLLALLLALLATFLLARRRRGSKTGPLALDPRERALTELDNARRTLWQRADQRPFFSAVSGAVRGYLAGVSPRWSTDLTTGELIRILAADGLDPHRRDQLLEVLDFADRVKFARLRLTEPEADAIWRAAREWVHEGVTPAPEAERVAQREAA